MSNENSKQNQQFSSMDTLALVASIMVVMAISVPILSRRVEVQHIEIAKKQAEDWSVKITSPENLSPDIPKKSGGREIASAQAEASVGVDPWGQPYKYAYILSSAGRPVYIAVYSSGPNGEFETSEEKLSRESGAILNAKFEGDDVGFVRALR